MKALLIASLMLAAPLVHAEETMKEKATAAKNSSKAALEKAGNRVEEAVCMEGDVKCAAKKAKHRVEETATKVSNKAKKAADSVDSNDTVNH